jgi:hypothetical protein
MKRAGILNALEKKYYPQRINHNPEEPSSVTFKRVMVFFLLLGTGIITAVLILILEITVCRRKQNKRIQKRNAQKELVWKKHHPHARTLSSDRQEK